MQTTIERIYKNKDVEMLTATATIIENAIANKALLIPKRATWQDPFFEDIKTEIETITDTYLGKDAAKELREATQIVLNIQAQAIIDLAEFKVQVQEDFKDNPTKRTEIINQLGLTTHHKTAQKGDQEALVNLLFKFKTNATPELIAAIVAKGTAQATINKILGYATTLKEANINQETFKGTKKEITDEGVTAFNNIYKKVISIAKISSNFLKTNKTKQQLFSFAKIVATLNNKPIKPITKP